MDFSDASTWLLVPLQILFVDLLLGADNAIVIALACRSLPPKDVTRAAAIGVGGAIFLRLIMTMVATTAADHSAGQADRRARARDHRDEHLVGRRLSAPEPSEDGPRGASSLWSAAAVIIVADAAMSLDNVVALAAIARGNFWLLAIGVALSLPVLAYGGVILTALLKRAPGLVEFGAALLGWIAGGMAISDPLVAPWTSVNAAGLVAMAPALGAAIHFPLRTAGCAGDTRLGARRRSRSSRALPQSATPEPMVESGAPDAVRTRPARRPFARTRRPQRTSRRRRLTRRQGRDHRRAAAGRGRGDDPDGSVVPGQL